MRNLKPKPKIISQSNTQLSPNNKFVPVYITVDIDVLDPAFAPATGTPEPGGLSSRELLRIIRGIKQFIGHSSLSTRPRMKIIGADMVEVSPSFDSAAEVTQVNGAYVILDIK